MELITNRVTTIRVNSEEIAEQRILEEMQYHTGDTQREAMIKASESLIIAEVLRQRAQTLGLATDDNHGDYADALIEAEVSLPKASEENCRHYYENNPDKFNSSPLLAVSHILLAADPDDELARMEAEDKAKLLLRQLVQNASLFPELAAIHSQCPSAKTQGQLGQISRGQTVPEFERQLFTCDVGLIPAPIYSRYGVHVVKVDHRVEGQLLPFSAVQQHIADYLNEKVKRKAIAQYIEKLLAEADIGGFDFSLSSTPLFQ